MEGVAVGSLVGIPGPERRKAKPAAATKTRASAPSPTARRLRGDSVSVGGGSDGDRLIKTLRLWNGETRYVEKVLWSSAVGNDQVGMSEHVRDRLAGEAMARICERAFGTISVLALNIHVDLVS